MQRLWVGRPVYHVKLSLYTRSCFINVKRHYIKRKTLKNSGAQNGLVCVVTPKTKWQLYPFDRRTLFKDIFNAHIHTHSQSCNFEARSSHVERTVKSQTDRCQELKETQCGDARTANRNWLRLIFSSFVGVQGHRLNTVKETIARCTVVFYSSHISSYLQLENVSLSSEQRPGSKTIGPSFCHY